MLKKTITYVDYNGLSRTEDFYFNLKESEVLEMQMMKEGGLSVWLEKIVAAQDQTQLFKVFKDLILAAYGEKSADGRRFMKSEEIRRNFEETEAFSILLMDLAGDDKKASEFVNSIIPAEMAKKVEKELANK